MGLLACSQPEPSLKTCWLHASAIRTCEWNDFHITVGRFYCLKGMHPNWQKSVFCSYPGKTYAPALGMHTPKGRERSVVTALWSTMKALSLIVTLLREQIFWVWWQLFLECGMSLKFPMLYSQVCFCVSIATHMIFFIASVKRSISSWTYFVGSSCNCQPLRRGLHFSRCSHSALQVIKLANECRMYCGASSAYATKNCLAFVMPASCILDAMVKEISGEPFAIFTVLQELSTCKSAASRVPVTPFLAPHDF